MGLFAFADGPFPSGAPMKIAVVAVGILVASCSTASAVKDTGNGIYLISAHGSARLGANGAHTIAYEGADSFCSMRQPGTHAVVVDGMERTTYQSITLPVDSVNQDSGGEIPVTAVNVNLSFRCGQ